MIRLASGSIHSEPDGFLFREYVVQIIRFIKANLIACLLGLALLVSLSWNAQLFLTRNPTVVTDDAIREEIVPIAKLGTYEYNFTELMHLDKANNPIGWKNPITSSRYLATIEGDVLIGVDVGKMEIKTARNPKDELTSIAITLPHSKAGNPNLYQDTLVKYVEDKGIFDLFKPSTDDLNELLTVAENNQLEKIEASGLLEESDKRVANLLTAFVQSTYGRNVDVSVDFDDSLLDR